MQAFKKSENKYGWQKCELLLSVDKIFRHWWYHTDLWFCIVFLFVICQVSQVYQTIEMKRFAALVPFATSFRLERLIVNAARQLELQVRTVDSFYQVPSTLYNGWGFRLKAHKSYQAMFCFLRWKNVCFTVIMFSYSIWAQNITILHKMLDKKVITHKGYVKYLFYCDDSLHTVKTTWRTVLCRERGMQSVGFKGFQSGTLGMPSFL